MRLSDLRRSTSETTDAVERVSRATGAMFKQYGVMQTHIEAFVTQVQSLLEQRA
ncbi:hypothetical protein CCP2SC5_1460008 [Azospirillaceae bacterium]